MLKFTVPVAAVLVAFGGSAAAAAVVPPAGLAPALASTRTQAFPTLRGMSDLGPADAALPMHIVVGLAMRNAPLLDTLLRRQVTPGDAWYGRFLTPQQTTALFGPTGAQVNAVATFLAQNGLRNIHASPDNLLLEADTTAGRAGAAFDTAIHIEAFGGSRIYANLAPARVPASLAAIVVAVEGLNSMRMHPHLVRAAPALARSLSLRRPAASAAQPCSNPVSGLCALNEYSATGFQLAYDSPQNGGANTNVWGYTGKNTPIAIFTEGKMDAVLTDLVKYENANVPALPHVPVTVVHAGIASPDVSGQDEWDLDSQTSTGMAGNVSRLYMYVATSLTDSDTSVAFDKFKTDDKAKAGSASFGECEIFPELDGALTLDDTIFAQAAVQGQTVFSSAGDNGTTCPVVASTGVPGTGLPFQSYPATSPYVISVGGTTLVTNAGTGTYNTELTWIGTGGGVSTEEPSPFWQQGVVPAIDNPPAGLPAASTFKAVPDIAMDADPNTGAAVYVNGVVTGVGGTSLASPLSLGVWARLESYHANGLGFAGPLLYQEYKKFTTKNAATGMYLPPTPPAGATTQLIGGFHDVIVGSNGTPALPGYDTTTGLGTFDIGRSFGALPTTYPH